MQAGFPLHLVDELRCPYCESGLKVVKSSAPHDLTAGVLRCDCYDYPVVDGIPVIRQISAPASSRNEASERILRGDVAGARTWLREAGRAPAVASPSSLRRRIAKVPGRLARAVGLGREGEPSAPIGADDFEGHLHATRSAGYAHYLYHRFANPSILGAIPPLMVLGEHCLGTPKRRLLELLCGTGHASAVLRGVCPGIEIVLTDIDFMNLEIARRFLSPGTPALCIDAEGPLPFQSKAFDGVFCMDGLHYVRSKAALLREVDRVVSDRGAWLFAHMHNADGDNVNAGTPLATSAYAARFAFGEHRLLAEAAILAEMRDAGSLDLTTQPEPARIAKANALTLFGARDASLWRKHAGLDRKLARESGLLALNPLYSVRREDGGFVAVASWPTEGLKAECTAEGAVLPQAIRLDDRLLDEIAATAAGAEPTEAVLRMIRQAVLVCLPQCYPRTPLPTSRLAENGPQPWEYLPLLNPRL